MYIDCTEREGIMERSKFYIKQLEQLVGGQVVGCATDGSPEGFVGLVVKTKSGKKIVWFLCDDEGNGPGSFDIQNTK